MSNYTYYFSILISLVLGITTGVQGGLPKAIRGQQNGKAPLAFKARLNYFIPVDPLPRTIQVLNETNTIDSNIRNDDPSRTIRELEYEIYTVDRQSGAEVDHIRRVDKIKIKAGEVRKRRTLSWNPDSLAKTCDPLSKCRIKIRVVRIEFDDGSEWKGQIEEEKDEKSIKK
jgi:hypothetical protein